MLSATAATFVAQTSAVRPTGRSRCRPCHNHMVGALPLASREPHLDPGTITPHVGPYQAQAKVADRKRALYLLRAHVWLRFVTCTLPCLTLFRTTYLGMKAEPTRLLVKTTGRCAAAASWDTGHS